MKIFVSWSGSLSREVALLLKSWLEDVLQDVEAWISTDDIDKGSLWFGDISGQLAETSIGILCLTRENITAPWILFEAGALSKGLSNSRVCPLLINLSPSDLKPPLSQFHSTLPIRPDMLKLVKTINAQNGDRSLSEDRVEKSFERWWGEFEGNFKKIVGNYKPSKEFHRRPVDEMVEEILQITRSLQLATQAESAKEAAVIVGSRRVGKSYLADRVLKEITKEKPQATIFVIEEEPEGNRLDDFRSSLRKALQESEETLKMVQESKLKNNS